MAAGQLNSTATSASAMGSTGLFGWFKPPPPIPRLPQSEIDRLYPIQRWRVFEAAFIAYATFYLVRNNLAPVAQSLADTLHYDNEMLGHILSGTAIAYGLGKFVMGYVADRCDARKYVAVGMLLTAVVNFAFAATRNYYGHIFLWTVNGFVQGMGYPPCTRGLSHWFSVNERGKVFGAWNVSHNLGGGVAGVLAAYCAKHWGWASAFYVPGLIATACACYLFWRMRDTPQSTGLPPIEEHRNDHPPEERESHERELTTRELFLKYILPNKMLWILAIANVFVYIARYAMVDWGPKYLHEVKKASLGQGGFSTLMIEFSGAAGMLVMGWISDRIGGWRTRASVCSMLPLLIIFPAILFAGKDSIGVDLFLFALLGFFVYPPVLFSGVVSLDLTTKKAVGTAAGFVGFFGYVGRVIQAEGLGRISKHYGWTPAIWAVLGCTVAGICLLSLLWSARPRG